MSGLRVTEREDGCTFGVHVLPRSRRDEVVGVYDGSLRVRLQAPPERGKANAALRAFLAHRLDVPKREVEILSGHTSRNKVVRVGGVRAADVQALLSEQR